MKNCEKLNFIADLYQHTAKALIAKNIYETDFADEILTYVDNYMEIVCTAEKCENYDNCSLDEKIWVATTKL